MSGTHLRGFAPEPTYQAAAVASRWQLVGDLVGSGFEPHTSRIRSEHLIFSYIICQK